MSDQFEMPAETVTRTGSKEEYFEFINSTYFDVCKGSKVLEIGPLAGWHTQFLISQNPAYIECIEPQEECANGLQSIKGIDKVIVDDAWLCINKPNKMDVVVCFGVLYHHHSSIQLLEQIVNYNNPKYIMLDNVNALAPNVNVEVMNTTGSRQVDNNWRHANINIVLPFALINQAMANMNYKLTQVDKLNYDWFSKSNSWVAMWENKE